MNYTNKNQVGTSERGTRYTPQERNNLSKICIFNKIQGVLGTFGTFKSPGVDVIFPTYFKKKIINISKHNI